MAAVATASRRTARPAYSGPYAQLINRSAARTGIDAWLLAAVLWIESKFNPHATSATGDVGIAQINLASHPHVTQAEALDPKFAIPWAARYLAELKRQAGSTKGALRAYNTGKPAASPAGNRYANAVLAARTDALKASRLTGSALSSRGYAGVDQGVDFTRTGPVPALAAGIITGVGTETDVEGEHGRYVIEKLTAGPHKGEYVYIAENLKPTVRRGQHVRAGQVLGRDLGITSRGTGIEIGFNRTPDGWNPVGNLGTTAEGQRMLAYINRRSRKNRRGGSSVPAAPAKGGGGGGVLGALEGFGNVVLDATPAGLAVNGAKGVYNIAKGAVDTVTAFGELAGRILTDPGYVFLWVGFAVVGLAFIFLGVERLLGRSATRDATRGVALVAAPETAAVGVSA